MSRVLIACLWLLAAFSGTLNAQTVVYIHTDALGSVVAETDANRNVLERREYEPYGQQLAPAIKNGPGYTGHVQDSGTGLVYMQQRYYDAGIGRFLSVDPVTANPNTGAMFNRYNYANNNPYKFTDPDGRMVCRKEIGESCARPPPMPKHWGRGSATHDLQANSDKKEAESDDAGKVRWWITEAGVVSGFVQAREPNAFKGKEAQTWFSSKFAPISKWGGDLSTRAERANFKALGRFGNFLGLVGLGYAGSDFVGSYKSDDGSGMALATGDATMSVLGLTPVAPAAALYEPVKAWGDYTESGAWYRSKVVESMCYVGGGCY